MAGVGAARTARGFYYYSNLNFRVDEFICVIIQYQHGVKPSEDTFSEAAATIN